MISYDRIYVCVDDTDDLTKNTSTGAVVEEIARRLTEEFGRKVNLGITRHQLLLDPRVPYTSHNSSMCFDIDLPSGSAARVDEIGWEVIRSMRAESANPGFCVLAIAMEDPGDGLHEDISSHADDKRRSKIREAYAGLIRYGQKCKREYVTIEEAEATAAAFPGMILKGEGLTRQGIVGALAGVGLRVGGDDGRFRGKYDMTSFSSRAFGSVAQCIGGFRGTYGVDPIMGDRTGGALGFHERIILIEDAKAVLNGGRFTILCRLGNDDMWRPYAKDDFNQKKKKKRSCDYFELDPDEEERFHEAKRRSCGSCLYRKLTDEGYVCSAGHEPVR